MSSLVVQLRSLPRSRLIIGGLALLMTVLIVTAFLLESRWGYTGRIVPVVFVQSWPADRSDADLAADRAAEVAHARTDAAQSRTYIATLRGAARTKAQAQYDAYIIAQPKALQPEGFVAPKAK